MDQQIVPGRVAHTRGPAATALAALVVLVAMVTTATTAHASTTSVFYDGANNLAADPQPFLSLGTGSEQHRGRAADDAGPHDGRQQHRDRPSRTAERHDRERERRLRRLGGVQHEHRGRHHGDRGQRGGKQHGGQDHRRRPIRADQQHVGVGQHGRRSGKRSPSTERGSRTPRSVSSRCSQALATSTSPAATGRCAPTPTEHPIRRSAAKRCCRTPAAARTRRPG